MLKRHSDTLKRTADFTIVDSRFESPLQIALPIRRIVAHTHTFLPIHTINNTSLQVGESTVSIGEITAVEVEATANAVFFIIKLVPATVTGRTSDGIIAPVSTRGG